ncbi:MAG: hypothetical protein JHC31_04375 [Sulfurihydrogenibium sp.]|jgi:hypothetical protein|nr:hypothetical protein [Sulfurihydrogenibium sp.]
MEGLKIKLNNGLIIASARKGNYWENIGLSKNRLTSFFDEWKIDISHPFTDGCIILHFECFEDGEIDLVEVGQCGCYDKFRINKVEKTNGFYKIEYQINVSKNEIDSIETGKISIQKVKEIELVSPSEIVEILAEKIKEKTLENKEFAVVYRQDNQDSWWFEFRTEDYKIHVNASETRNEIILSETTRKVQEYGYSIKQISYNSEYSDILDMIFSIIQELRSEYQCDYGEITFFLSNKK